MPNLTNLISIWPIHNEFIHLKFCLSDLKSCPSSAFTVGDIPDAASEAANVCQCMDFPRFIRHRKHRQTPPVSASVLWQHGEDEKCVWQNEALRSATGMSQIHWSHFTYIYIYIYFFPWEWRQETCKAQRELGTPANWKNYSMNNSFPLSRWRCWRIRFQVVKG